HECIQCTNRRLAGVGSPSHERRSASYRGRPSCSIFHKTRIALGLEKSALDEWVIHSRTLQHRRSRREKLTVEESDRVMRMIRVLSLTESTYGSRDRALDWLRKPNLRLDGRPPLSLLKTDTGSR